jgi:tetratricopeptide (TPR) repeat protein
MGFRIRKSIRIAPGVRLNLSKSGIGYSFGVKGYRVTKRADGRLQQTLSLPGTGLSHVTTSGSARRSSRRMASPPTPRRPAPGFAAPKAEEDLYKALQNRDTSTMERIAQDPKYALAAASITGVLKLAEGDEARSFQLLEWVFADGRDPAQDPFIGKYVRIGFRLEIAPGVRAQLGFDRNSIGLALAELHQRQGDIERAIDVVEQLEPTTVTAVSLAELYNQTGRYRDVVALTNGIVNEDDATALLCVFRGVALREQGYADGAREMFKEALKSKRRDAVIRHRALIERARTYEAEGKRSQARRDLERVLAEDATYAGLGEELAKLSEQ